VRPICYRPSYCDDTAVCGRRWGVGVMWTLFGSAVTCPDCLRALAPTSGAAHPSPGASAGVPEPGAGDAGGVPRVTTHAFAESSFPWALACKRAAASLPNTDIIAPPASADIDCPECLAVVAASCVHLYDDVSHSSTRCGDPGREITHTPEYVTCWRCRLFANLPPLASPPPSPIEPRAEARARSGGPPAHYDLDPEPMAAIQGWGLSFCLGSAVKYIARADRKGSPVEDLRKAIDCIEREIEWRERGGR
jgi:hypothetical protein